MNSFMAKRTLSTLIPPKIASPCSIGHAQDAARMSRIVNFYEKLPRGPAPIPMGSGFYHWYRQKYFSGPTASAKPLLHALVFLSLLGYAQSYYFHLRKR